MKRSLFLVVCLLSCIPVFASESYERNLTLADKIMLTNNGRDFYNSLSRPILLCGLTITAWRLAERIQQGRVLEDHRLKDEIASVFLLTVISSGIVKFIAFYRDHELALLHREWNTLSSEEQEKQLAKHYCDPRLPKPWSPVIY